MPRPIKDHIALESVGAAGDLHGISGRATSSVENVVSLLEAASASMVKMELL